MWKSNPPPDPRRTASPALKAGKVTGPRSPPKLEYHYGNNLLSVRNRLRFRNEFIGSGVLGCRLRLHGQKSSLPDRRNDASASLRHCIRARLHRPMMHSLVRFCYLAAESTFTTRELYPQTLEALQMPAEQYKLASLRYDLWKLRAKGLIEKIPHSRRYRLLPMVIRSASYS